MAFKRNSPQPIIEGGTGAQTLTGVVIGHGTSALTGNAVTQHDVLVGGASNAITSVAPSATSGVALVSGGASADPSFGTVVVAGGGTGQVSFTANAPIVAGSSSTAALVQVTTGLNTAGYLLTANASGAPTFQAAPAGFTWNAPTGSTVTMAINNGYIDKSSGFFISFELPATIPRGSVFRVTGRPSSPWSIIQQTGQTIYFGTQTTTTGGIGGLSSDGTDGYTCVELLCITADTDLMVLSSVGNIIVA